MRLPGGLALCVCLCAAVLAETEKSVREGESVEFQCNVSPLNKRIEWKFSSEHEAALLYYDSQLTASYKDRAEYYPQGLKLNGVTRKDAGVYVCEVTDNSSGKTVYSEFRTRLFVLVPPSVPEAQVPTSATIGSSVTMSCVENEGFPPPVITWYRNKSKLPQDPKTSPAFQNMTYTMDPTTGDLTFSQVSPLDSGDYYCEASNYLGVQRSAVVTMETSDEKNIGGIVAAVLIVLLILALIAFGFWFAYSRGYIGKKTNKKVIYSQPSETRSDKNFQQTSSFVV